jgi:thiamine biosynthesis lipoprotein
MKSRSSEIRRARPVLGTIVEIGAVGLNAGVAIDAAFCEIYAIHRLMSFHEEGSDVSRLNRSVPGEVVRVDPSTYEVLVYARELSRLSAGAFDITVGGKLVEQGFLPRPHGATPVDSEASFEDIKLLANDSVSLTRRLWIDLGGIAKGYAADRAALALKMCGVTTGIVNAGGDLYVFGAPQPIHLRYPNNPSLVLPLGMIANSAVASSSGCFANAGEPGAAAEPLIDPRRNASMKWQRGITVIAPRCVIADALTKVVRLAPRRAPKILSRFSARAVIVDRLGARPFNGQHNEMRHAQARSAVSHRSRAVVPAYRVAALEAK